MMRLEPWQGTWDAVVRVPGDKSLTHRGILFSLLAEREVELTGWLDAQDTRSSLEVAQELGAEVLVQTPERLVLKGPGRPHMPQHVLDAGNSGTTMRLASGLISAVQGPVVISGDASLSRRPMGRVIEPLGALGVKVQSRRGGLAPLVVYGGAHAGGSVTLPVASAQVKSAVLLAGLSASGPVTVREPVPSRDHTERLLSAMGARLVYQADGAVTVEPGTLAGLSFPIAGDPSSAAFWAALAALQEGRRVVLPGVLFNPTRTGFFRVLEHMGAGVEWDIAGRVPEPWGSISVKGAPLQAIQVEADAVPAMVDEIPLVALLATKAHGISHIRGAAELRVKESDRIRVTTLILRQMGAHIEEQQDGWIIEGPTRLTGATVDACGDHRMAMLAAVAASIAEGPVDLSGEESVAISYPTFFADYHALGATRR